MAMRRSQRSAVVRTAFKRASRVYKRSALRGRRPSLAEHDAQDAALVYLDGVSFRHPAMRLEPKERLRISGRAAQAARRRWKSLYR